MEKSIVTGLSESYKILKGRRRLRVTLDHSPKS